MKIKGKSSNRERFAPLFLHKYLHMINGFTIEVRNNSGQENELCLFKDGGRPAGVLVTVVNGRIGYDSLLNLASTIGFVGSGIMVNNEQIKFVTVYDGSNFETISFDKLILQKEIFIDGVDKYISLKIPPESEGSTLIQLIP